MTTSTILLIEHKHPIIVILTAIVVFKQSDGVPGSMTSTMAVSFTCVHYLPYIYDLPSVKLSAFLYKSCCYRRYDDFNYFAY